ncbi:Gfo/Idh/MocA family protein [Plantactinospora sp. WMMC1484]|uniref:Gfo/Idh/MocA family protein n=1 Tax=Plantactinospora sp. WMMC1484 TaxID=3404122 RepID=UPI003BF4DEF9
MADPRPIRIGVAGLTSDHVWSLVSSLRSLPAVDVVAVAEQTAALRERAGEAVPGVVGYEDPEAMLAAERLDAVLVCAENAAKPGIAVAALQRGVAVYQDKPLAATGEQAAVIAEAVRRTGGLLMCAFHTAFDPLVDEVGQLVRDGLLGTVQFARGLAGHAGLRATGVSDDFAAWLTDRSRGGGGSFVDQAGYLLTTLVAYLGPVERISGFAATVDPDVPPEIEDNTAAIVRHAGGALAAIDTRWGQVGPTPLRYSFHGTTGTLSVYADRYELVTTAKDGPTGWESVAAPPGLTGWRSAVTPRASYDDEAAHFVAALRDGAALRPTVTAASALHVQRVIDAYYESVRTGQAVTVPASTEAR